MIINRLPYHAQDHPRIHGEHSVKSSIILYLPGSPPHTRGTLIASMLYPYLDRITPAYTGNTRNHKILRGYGQDHPRIHGEHRLSRGQRLGGLGSPPHTRGTRLLKERSYNGFGITPAYTGNTKSITAQLAGAEDHPRIHGEHVVREFQEWANKGSPPHTRGTRKRQDACSFADRITPAYTGNTAILRRHRFHRQDHPRIHGEHPGTIDFPQAGEGSPPHTRGTPHRHIPFPSSFGITPAYTGNTP